MKKIFDDVEFHTMEYPLEQDRFGIFLHLFAERCVPKEFIDAVKIDKDEYTLKIKDDLLQDLNRSIYEEPLLQDITNILCYMNQLRPLLINNQIAMDIYDKAYKSCTKLFLNITRP